jgi:uncharacterized membrane-anchored protein YhcB (DUF1043 family)|tara:strand:- start:695 stop:1261 length:567 start_codon:yes stop_codon:yes gene_type:complete
MAIPVGIAIAAIAAPIIMGGIAAASANNAANTEQQKANQLQKDLDALERGRQEIVNPYANLSVATQAADIKMEEIDYNLSATLDTIQAMGAGASSATALAKEANKAKLQIAADIEKQEVANEKLKAEGEKFVFQQQEAREMQKLDRTAGLLDRSTLQAAQYRSDAMASLTGGVQGAASITGSVAPYMG